MKNITLLAFILIAAVCFGQVPYGGNILQQSNSSDSTFSLYYQNTPTSIYGNRFNVLWVTKDGWYIRQSTLYFDSASFTGGNPTTIAWIDTTTKRLVFSPKSALTIDYNTNITNKPPLSGYMLISDTASMLLPYLLKTDTTGKWYPRYTNPNSYLVPSDTSGKWYPLYLNPNAYLSSYTEADPLFNSKLATKTTTDLSEGVNLYYTSARFNSAFASKTTSDLSEGSNLYYTAARFSTAFALKTTSDLTEGSNLYFTNARARSSISLTTTGTSGSATYNSSTGILNIPNYANSGGTVTSVGVSAPSAFSVSGSPVTTSGTISITGAGTASQVIDGTGALKTINTFTAYASGTIYSLTTTSQKVDFGTTDPSITITAPGTYLILTNVRLGYNGLVSLGNQTANLKLRRTNNTASDIANSSTNFVTPVAAVSLTTSAGDCDIPAIIYTTSNNNDVIELWGSITAALGGAVQVQEASVVAIRIY